ncbi:MAG: cytochrome c [Paracoccaceae bacterium]|nr:cytochrome c [Paracoccaceae bacterium]
MRNLIISAILLLASLAQPNSVTRTVAAEQMLGNATEGLRFARDHCADCHQVEPGEAPAVIPAGKSFIKVAADPKMTALSLRVFLRTPHIDMPDFKLTEEQTDDVIAYILSLK